MANFLDELKAQSDKVLQNVRKKQDKWKPNIYKKNDKRNSFIILMRHSVRFDTNPVKHIKWENKYLRPYDPPISDHKLPVNVYKNSLLKCIQNVNIQMIIVSPFLRTVQTAYEIGKCIKNKVYVIDSRFGEQKHAINRCIKARKQEISNNDDIQININDYNDATFMKFNDIKKILNPNNDKSIKIIWNNMNKHKPGNEQYMQAIKGLKATIKHNNGDILVVTHGGIISDIIENLTRMIISVKECGWVTFNNDASMQTYSNQRIQVIYNPHQT